MSMESFFLNTLTSFLISVTCNQSYAKPVTYNSCMFEHRDIFLKYNPVPSIFCKIVLLEKSKKIYNTITLSAPQPTSILILKRAKNKDWRAAHKVAVIKLGGWKDREGRRRKLINIWSSWLWPYGSCCPDKEIKNRGVRLQLSGQFRQLKSTSSKLVVNTKTFPQTIIVILKSTSLIYDQERKKWVLAKLLLGKRGS